VHRRPFDAGGTGKHLGESSLIQRAFAGKRFFLLANFRIATNSCTGSESGNGYYRAGISRGPHGQGAGAHPTERRAPASGKLHTRLQCFVVSSRCVNDAAVDDTRDHSGVSASSYFSHMLPLIIIRLSRFFSFCRANPKLSKEPKPVAKEKIENP